jgi:hypothetical protein
MNMQFFKKPPDFIWSANNAGLAVRFGSAKLWRNAQTLKAPLHVQNGYRRMQMLTECGEAEVSDVDFGVFIASADAVRLDESTREVFQLPSCWPGGMRLETELVPNMADFVARLVLVDELAGVAWNWQLRGPVLEVGTDHYLPTAAQFAALSAFKSWEERESRDELDHLSLIASLREAHIEGCLIDLEAYSDEGSVIVRADEIALHASKDKSTGDLILTPLPIGRFPDLTPDEIRFIRKKCV